MIGVRIFVTGGTFDKEYDEISEKHIFKNTHVPELLKRGRCKSKVRLTKLMLIDSLGMTKADRTKILRNCEKAKEKSIVITHGTSTMAETAKVLGNRIKNKTIVLTGAMVPYRYADSDGLFNLGCAIAFAQALPHGTYIAMNGRYFQYNNVKKNVGRGEFEELK